MKMADHDHGSRGPAGESGRILIWGAVALAVGAAVVVSLLLRHPERPDSARAELPPMFPQPELAEPRPLRSLATAPAPTIRAPVNTASAVPPPPAPLPPIDFFTEDVSETLRKTHEVTLAGGLLPVERMKELYQLGKDNLGDARPHLVMAEDAMNRGWDEFAVDHYSRAQKEDPRARQDPRMLKDLVALASGKRNGAKAADALTSIYGRAAIPAVEDAIAAAGDKADPATLERLEALSRSLGSSVP